MRIHPYNQNLESPRPQHLSFKLMIGNMCNVCQGMWKWGRGGRGIGGVLGLALGGVHVCAAQAPLGPHLLFKMKAFSRS